MLSGQPFRTRRLRKTPPRFLLDRSLPRPCVSLIHNNYCAVWTWWLLENHFEGGDWLIFCFSSCYFVYDLLSSFFIIPRRTVEPSIFKENRPAVHKMWCFLFWLFASAFLFVFSYFFDFRVPLPPPGPDWKHCWSILVPFLFDLVEVVRRRTRERQNDATLRQQIPKARREGRECWINDFKFWNPRT